MTRRQVRDVMTTKVITVDRITPYKEIAAHAAAGGGWHLTHRHDAHQG